MTFLPFSAVWGQDFLIFMTIAIAFWLCSIPLYCFPGARSVWSIDFHSAGRWEYATYKNSHKNGKTEYRIQYVHFMRFDILYILCPLNELFLPRNGGLVWPAMLKPLFAQSVWHFYAIKHCCIKFTVRMSNDASSRHPKWPPFGPFPFWPSLFSQHIHGLAVEYIVLL